MTRPPKSRLFRPNNLEALSASSHLLSQFVFYQFAFQTDRSLAFKTPCGLPCLSLSLPWAHALSLSPSLSLPLYSLPSLLSVASGACRSLRSSVRPSFPCQALDSGMGDGDGGEEGRGGRGTRTSTMLPKNNCHGCDATERRRPSCSPAWLNTEGRNRERGTRQAGTHAGSQEGRGLREGGSRECRQAGRQHPQISLRVTQASACVRARERARARVGVCEFGAVWDRDSGVENREGRRDSLFLTPRPRAYSLSRSLVAPLLPS